MISNLKVGEGIVIQHDSYELGRGVITEVYDPLIHGSAPGIVVDFQSGRQYFYPMSRLCEFEPDPEGPYSEIRTFTCTGESCIFYREKGRTALNVCPRCGEFIFYIV